MRLPERSFEWQVGAWKLGVILCPGIWRVSFWWDGSPHNLTITLPLMHIWFEHDGGNHWPWEWTILRLVIGKQEIRTDLALNYWGLGVAVHQTNDWSIHHPGPIDIECEYDKFYDLNDDCIGPRFLFDCSRRYANCASVNVILMVMEDEVPGNENCQRLKLAPAVQARLAEIKRLEHVLEKLSDAELKCKTDKLRGSAAGRKSGGQSVIVDGNAARSGGYKLNFWTQQSGWWGK